MHMQLNLKLLWVIFGVCNSFIYATEELPPWTTSCRYEDHDVFRLQKEKKLVTFRHANNIIKSFWVRTVKLQQFGMIRSMLEDLPDQDNAIDIPLSNNTKTEQTLELDALSYLFEVSNTDKATPKNNFILEKEIVIQANKINASENVWGTLKEKMPYAVCTVLSNPKLIGSNNTDMERYSDLFDKINPKEKNELKVLFYKELYSGESFKKFQEAVKDAQEKMKGALTIDELEALPEYKQWSKSGSFKQFFTLCKPKNTIDINNFSIFNEINNNISRFNQIKDYIFLSNQTKDEFLHIPIIALFLDARKKIITNDNYDQFIYFTNKTVSYVTDIDLQAVQSLASLYCKKPIRLCINLCDNPTIDWESMQKLKPTPYGNLIHFELSTKQCTKLSKLKTYYLATHDATRKTIQRLVSIVGCFCATYLLHKLISMHDAINYKEYCAEVTETTNSISPEVKSHILYIIKNDHIILPNMHRSNIIPAVKNWQSHKAVCPSTTQQTFDALAATRRLYNATIKDFNFETRCEKATLFAKFLTACHISLSVACLDKLVDFFSRSVLVPNSNGEVAINKWYFLNFIAPKACTITYK